jgi:hypothetical protein
LLQVHLIFCLWFDRADARECRRDDRWVMLIQWANLNGSKRFPWRTRSCASLASSEVPRDQPALRGRNTALNSFLSLYLPNVLQHCTYDSVHQNVPAGTFLPQAVAVR